MRVVHQGTPWFPLESGDFTRGLVFQALAPPRQLSGLPVLQRFFTQELSGFPGIRRFFCWDKSQEDRGAREQQDGGGHREGSGRWVDDHRLQGFPPLAALQLRRRGARNRGEEKVLEIPCGICQTCLILEEKCSNRKDKNEAETENVRYVNEFPSHCSFTVSGGRAVPQKAAATPFCQSLPEEIRRQVGYPTSSSPNSSKKGTEPSTSRSTI